VKNPRIGTGGTAEAPIAKNAFFAGYAAESLALTRRQRFFTNLSMDPLLQLLRENCLQSHNDIARQLGVGEEEVARRMAAAEASGLILGYQAVLDPEQTGNGDVTAVIEVKITPEREGGFDRLARRIARFEEVESCYLMSGGYDLLVVVNGRDLRGVATFVAERLSTIEGVLSTATHFRLKCYKENGRLLTREEEPERLAVSP